MPAATRLFLLLGLFLILDAALYVVWGLFFAPSYLSQGATGGGLGHVEWVGTITLVLCAALAFLVGFFMYRVGRAQNGELPEDRRDANIDDGEGEQGFFSPWSWWPISLSGGAAMMFAGLAVGNWLCFIAVPLIAIAVVGMIFEYQRGYFGH